MSSLRHYRIPQNSWYPWLSLYKDLPSVHIGSAVQKLTLGREIYILGTGRSLGTASC